jgi:2-amino-4-hydroxy-6-hydroxymethyldihydropteridine diphosphokinase
MILIALGANLPSSAGTPAETLIAALQRLKANDIIPVQVSRLYRSEAWPDPADPPFVNAVAQVTTALSPVQLLEDLNAVEQSFGRIREKPNAPRTLDLDILDYDGRIESGPPMLPHPRMENRAFVLVPLAGIAPEWRHPISGRTVDELLRALPESATNQVIPLPSGGTPR